MEAGTFLTELGIILLLILGNGLFSMAEMAVVSARKVRLLQRAEDGDQKSRAALDLAQAPNRFLSTVQIGITLISTLTGAIGGATMTNEVEALLNQVPWLASYSHVLAIGLIVLLVTYLSLVIGELVPKRLALADPEGISRSVAVPMKLLSKLGTPVVWLLSVSTDGVMRLIGAKKGLESPVTPEEITTMMEQGESVGVFEETETDIVESIFRLGDLRAGALMTPRTELDWLDLQDPLDVNLMTITNSHHTTFPVAENDLDNVVGILRAKDFLIAARSGSDLDLRQLIEPAQFIPESMPAFQVLELLKNASDNMVLVIDEYGGVLGMITLFDVMEAMVGDIAARGMPATPEAVQREDGSWLIEGMMRIDEFKKLFDIDELPDEDRAGYQTVGGFVMTQIGAVPSASDHFDCCGLTIEVIDMDNLRVDKVLVRKADTTHP